MNKFLPPRRLIPQWRKASFAIHQPDMIGLVNPVEKRAPLEIDDSIFRGALDSWNTSQSVGSLADLLSFGVDPAAHTALEGPARAALLMASVSPVMRLVAESILASKSSEEAIWQSGSTLDQIRGIRSILRMAPNDTIALVELAQHHLTHGKKKQAYRCLATAFQLSPKSTFVIRAVARYWVHIGKPDKAHYFIKKLNLSSEDPWLMASEIALAQVAKVPSTQLRKGQRALTVKAFSPKNATELAAAVGDFELFNGKLKEARKLFRTALDAPNDNVLAQTIHKQSDLGIEIDEQILQRASNGVFEGRAYQAILSADFEAAARFTALWGESEPFSSRPKMLESFVNGSMGVYDKALVAALAGLRADPSDLMLRGNKAYALAGLGRFADAEAELKAIAAKNGGQVTPSNNATRGMIEMLRGDIDQGIALYSEAISQFSARKDDESVTTCRAFMARAAVTAKAPQSVELVKVATERFSKVPSPAAAVILRTLSQEADIPATSSLRRVTQWEWDSDKNTLAEKRKLTRVGAPGFVLKNKFGKQ